MISDSDFITMPCNAEVMLNAFTDNMCDVLPMSYGANQKSLTRLELYWYILIL